jgi:hypothetical protein
METSYKNQLITDLTEKGLAPSSIKLYVRNLEKLSDTPLKNLSFLKDVEKITDKLQKYKENTKRGFLISIVSALSLDKKHKKLYDTYYKLMMDKNKELKAVEASGEKTETQQKNWITWDEVGTKMKDLEDKVNSFGKEINAHQYDILLQEIILALYYYKAPRRNEYQKMNLVKTITGQPDTLNYLDYDKKQFVFNVFKTARKEGQVKEDIPPELFAIIQKYLKYHPLVKGKITKATNVPFLVYHDGKPLSQINAITRVLNKIFGKAVGSSMLRSIYLTSKYGNIKEEMREDSKAMSHSVQTQQNNYVKK